MMLSEKTRGNIFLKIGIAAAAVLLLWTIVPSIKTREERLNYLHLTRAKMKTLAELENRYFFQQAGYTADFNELKKIVPGVPDSVFRPVWAAYQRVNRSLFQKMSFDEFKRTYVDSLIINPLTGEKVLMETAIQNGRPTFSIRPSAESDDIRSVGGVIDGDITWDDKAEAAL